MMKLLMSYHLYHKSLVLTMQGTHLTFPASKTQQYNGDKGLLQCGYADLYAYY